MKKTMCIAAASAAVLLLLSGCTKKSQKDIAAERGYDFYIFNTKGENADAMKAAADAFAATKDIKVKVFSLGSGTNSDDTLRTENNSKNKPAIFSIMNSQALVEWVEGGFAMDLNQAKNADFKKLAAGIPESFNLSQDGINYGIPYNVEGYGLIVDKDMIGDLIGKSNVESFIAAYKKASYKEFETMISILNSYIEEGTAQSFKLNNTEFTLASSKTGKAASLKGVFSMAGSEHWTYGDHLVNIAIDTMFKNPTATKKATKEQIAEGKAAFKDYAQLLDLMSANATSKRGAELINATQNGYDQSVAHFANSQAIFLKQGNWAYTNIKKANPEIVNTLTFLPIKMPFKQSDIKVSGLTVEHMNSSIPVFVPNYYAINNKVSDYEKELAEEFLVWLNTSKEGQKFVVKDMAFIPYNANPEKNTSGYSLGDSIISYMAQNKTITNAYAGCPVSWSGDNLGAYVMENYLNKQDWPANAYNDIANYAISSWTEMAGLE